MSKNTTLHFFCGKMAAGKSTLAKELAKQHNAVLLIEDNWLSQLYPEEINDIPGYIEYSARLKSIMSAHVQALLAHGLSVVLDFPANTIQQRRWFRYIITQAEVSHILHFVDVSDDVCKRQLEKRSLDKPEGTAFTSEAEFDALTRYFQPPAESEGFNIVRYERTGTQ